MYVSWRFFMRAFQRHGELGCNIEKLIRSTTCFDMKKYVTTLNCSKDLRLPLVLWSRNFLFTREKWNVTDFRAPVLPSVSQAPHISFLMAFIGAFQRQMFIRRAPGHQIRLKILYSRVVGRKTSEMLSSKSENATWCLIYGCRSIYFRSWARDII